MKKVSENILVIMIIIMLVFSSASCRQEELLPEQTTFEAETQTPLVTTNIPTKTPVPPAPTPTDQPIKTVPNQNVGYMSATTVPSLYITLKNNRQKGSITKETYIDAVYSLVGSDTYADIVDNPISVKGRGNYSWSFDKKPLTLSLPKKQDWLGMGEGKKWVLINNYVDKTLLRNYITFCFARDVGMNYTPDCRFVDVYLNGKYEGNYLLFEKIGISENRVSIDESDGILFEIEMPFRHEDCTDCYETPSGVHLMYSDYEGAGAAYPNMDSILKKMDQSLSKGYAEYSKYIDVDSFIDWYIVNEFAKNYDSKFVTSCYCYYSNGKIYMGPVWDYDTCYGNQNTDGCMYPEGFHVSQAPWYQILLSDETFSKKLSEKWNKIYSDGTIDKFFNYIDYADKLIATSRNKNFERWPDCLNMTIRSENPYYTYAGELGHLKKFITERKNWLNAQWSNLGSSFSNVDKYSIKGSSGANSGETAEKAFDGNTSTKFCTLDSLPVQIEWKMKEAVIIKKYSIATANDEARRNPKEWKLYGSNDGNKWTIISDVKDGALPETFFTYKEFNVNSPGKYLHYKIVIYANAGNDYATQFSELKLIE